jgi:UDP-N-acetylmuramoyl-tripeptide--D-alanyl-D-alanine ligase
MQLTLMTVIALLWLIGTNFRVYRQARFYQIEEYMSERYIRWLFSEREKWLPIRSIAIFLVGIVLAFFNDSIPNETALMPYIISILAAAIAIWPPREVEVKKTFVRTQRATRMLGMIYIQTALFAVLWLIVVNEVSLESDRFSASLIAIGGLVNFLLAPAWLMLGNVLMTPVEAAMRQRFIHQAESVLESIQPKIIGITGSYGKTTTKNFLRDILGGRYKIYATPKSYNTLMGICLAINNDVANDYSIEYFISEMGAYVGGEIERICQLTPPDISIVVEVGPQHLERFGTLKNTARAKYEIIENLPPHGLGVFNWDNAYVREMYEKGYPDNRIAVSKAVSPDDVPENGPRFIASEIQETLNGLGFTISDTQTGDSERIETPVIGRHNVTNLLLSIAVAVHEGMSLHDVALRAKMLQPAESRLVRQTSDTGITIINDAYSANPVGVISALQVLGMHTTGKRLLITPGMVELGELQDKENYKLGELATEYATDIILVGEKQTEPIKQGILSTHFSPENLHTVETLSDAVNWYQDNLEAGDAVLFLNDLPDTY